MIYSYAIHDIVGYINWVYFFHTWQLGAKFASVASLHGCDTCRAGWLVSFPEEERSKAAEALQLFKEAQRMLNLLDKDYRIQGITELFGANSEGDDILVFDSTQTEPLLRLPMLRQQVVTDKAQPCVCLSDFIAPLALKKRDRIGFFATAVDPVMEQLFAEDPYQKLLVQTLCDRLAEAAAEKMHEEVRKKQWGYAPEEKLTRKELWMEQFAGTRPAVGYPALPDQSLIFLIDSLLPLRQIGINLTENGAMVPHASVCGLMISHPASYYFSVGKISPEQLEDYARRRGFSVEDIQRFLLANL